MAQLNITLNQEEILQLLSVDRDEAFRTLLTNSLNSILKAESQEQLRAAPYERSDERTDSRNGIRSRTLKTRIGTITLEVPRHRNQPFKTLVFDNYSRSEAALIASMAEMVVNGVSTRKVSNVIETLCGTSVSKSQVSEVCQDLDQEVEAFRNRPIEGIYPFLTVDATYFKVRENNRIISKALMIAYGTNECGMREILGFSAYPKESSETWTDFLMSLRNRGLDGLMMITSDAHEGLIHALHRVFPDVPWQRCQFHFSRNISDKAPKKFQSGLRAELQEMFSCSDMKEARKKRDEILDEYRDIAESAMACLEEGFESSMTVMNLPKSLRIYFRTSNHIERLNKELKRRSQVIGIFPNTGSLIRLMGAVLIEQNSIRQSRKSIFSQKYYRKMQEAGTKEKLVRIAEEQIALLAA
ncbi:Transposase (or an inactivated derivative) [Eubacterium pyruvativorans]|jgi:putative transposase|uniref:Mutator family transposase n=5 Tax=Eubacterium pyruvativorans TaxID=155865 RepID=A0A1I7HWA4_9FIRM|nr:IS256 family transposase [Eubacterium pyruvativorans]SFO33657.1 Transposase (or an inactivated derivative) [Eubacterium pyruvativorans]SFU64899.1 Transposase (or an inactivated derivative) [Eubacterium pyruvativorans]